jgi:predicted transcriptional regulator
MLGIFRVTAHHEKARWFMRKKGTKAVYLDLPIPLVERLRALAEKHRRSLVAEAAVALEEYLERHGHEVQTEGEVKATAKPNAARGRKRATKREE